MKTVLVTGASGFVGRHLMHLMRQEDAQAFGFSQRLGYDIRDYEMVRNAITVYQPDEIHHLAAQPFVPESATNPRRGYEVNLLGTLNLLEAVRQTGSRARIHIAGTSEEYGYALPHIDEDTPTIPVTPYGASKLSASQLAWTYHLRYEMPVVITRAFNHTGPGQADNYAIPSFARQVALFEEGKIAAVRHGNLDAVRDYSDVRDIVRAYRLAIQLDPGVYNLCSGVATSLDAILTTLGEMSSTGGILRREDPGLYRPGFQTGSSVFPTTTAQRFVRASGWVPEFTLEQTLADTLAHWREQIA